MSYEEYWTASPYMAIYYYRANELRKEQRSQEMWLQGFYIYDAMSVVMANSFSKKKNEYIKEPIRITPKTEKEKQAEVKREQKKIYDAFKHMAEMQKLKKGEQ